MADKTRTISFRIRRIDTDLTEAIATISKEDLANKARDGLRLILGLTTSRVSQVVERPIVSSQPKQERQKTEQQPQRLGNQGSPLAPIYKPKS